MQSNPNAESAASTSEITSLAIAAKAARKFFIAEMQADGATHVAYGATIMTREQWGLWLSMAIAQVVMQAPKLALVDVLNVCLASDLGNVSQLTKAFISEQVLFVATAANEAGSLTDRLAKRAQAVSEAPKV